MDIALALLAIVAPVAIGAALLSIGLSRRLAPWAWLAGLAVAIVPAVYMAAVNACSSLAGTCIKGDELTQSRQAAISVVLFAVAGALLAVRRSRVRDAAFAALVLAGQLWLLLKLLAVDELPAAILVIALVLMELVVELRARLALRAAASAA